MNKLTITERLHGVMGSLNMLAAVLRCTDILKADSSDITDIVEGCSEDIMAALNELNRRDHSDEDDLK